MTRRQSRSRSRERRRRSRSGSRNRTQNTQNNRNNHNHERDVRKPATFENPRSSELFAKRQVNRMSIMESGAPKVWARSPEPITSDSDDEEYLAMKVLKEEKARVERAKVEKAEALRKIAEEKDATMISSEDERVKHKHKKSKKSKKKKRKDRKSSNEEDQWVENTEAQWVENTALEKYEEKETEEIADSKASNIIGPEMPEALASLYDMDFGKGLMPGEGVAMAEFVANGQRIPRRGEIGMTNDDIQAFERAGYIMSGNRHRRMEAVRLRKESQIYSAEEKRALQLYSKQERDGKESGVIQQFRDMVKVKTRETQDKRDENDKK